MSPDRRWVLGLEEISEWGRRANRSYLAGCVFNRNHQLRLAPLQMAVLLPGTSSRKSSVYAAAALLPKV